jgi:hypothetical protein
MPTSRSSERPPAGTPSGDAAVLGGWLPSLTFDVRDSSVGYAVRQK